MSNSFYRAFEDRHRGSRELIKARLGAYLPFLVPLAAGQRPAALDLGCGRGEWLELLGETGFAARGVDLDEGMLAACRERGLEVATGDALACLRAQPDASLALVSAFHLIEHIPFDAVQELIQQALRALQPGGLLILETPNPENLVVATSGFYMDPSHLHPVPPQLLEFVVEFNGFARHKVVRLQEPAQLHGAARVELINVLDGVSPDYSVVAQKPAELAVTAPFDAAFATAFGLELSTLARRYQAQQDQQHSDTQAGIAQLAERVAAAELSATGLFQRTLETIGEAQAATRQAHLELHAMQQRERTHEATLHALTLGEVEARAASYLHQAQEAGARALHAEQRVAAAEQRAAAAEQRADAAEQRADAAEPRAAEAEQRAAEAEQRAAEAEQRASEAERQAAEHLQRTEQAGANAESHAQHVRWQLDEMTARARTAEQKVSELYASTSWRMMRPARAAMTLLRRPLRAADVARLIAAREKARAAGMLMPLVRHLARRPAARAFAMRALARFPALERRMRSLAYRALHGTPTLAPPAAAAALAPAAAPGQPQPAVPANLSRSAQKIFVQLQDSAHSDDIHNES